MIRALEVFIETGQPISQLQQKQPPPYSVVQIGLTLERDQLYQRADQRVDLMLEQGFLEEVRHLLDMGYNRKLPSMSGLGYAQLAAHLADEVALDEAIFHTKTATHDFIRRQYTWFRGHDSGIHWYDAGQVSLPEILTLIETGSEEQI